MSNETYAVFDSEEVELGNPFEKVFVVTPGAPLESSTNDQNKSSAANKRSKTDKPEEEIGFSKEAFATLKSKIGDDEIEICSLLIDEMRLCKKIERVDGRTWGCVEEGIETYAFKRVATKVLVFMVTAVNANWKLPIAFYPIIHPTTEEMAKTILEALTRLHEVNIKVICITTNGISSYLSFSLAEQLGAKIDPNANILSNIVPSFPHPVNGMTVNIMYDIITLIDVLNIHWTEVTKFFDSRDRPIFTQFVSVIRDVKEDELIEITSSEEVYYDWIVIKKRINYDPRMISKTMADALQYLKDIGYPQVVDSEGTISFLRILHNLYVFSTIRNPDGKGTDSPLNSSNERVWQLMLFRTIEYLKTLKTDDNVPLRSSKFRTPIIGLIVSIISIMQLYEHHFMAEENCQMLTNKFSLGHLKDFFQVMRFSESYHPTVSEFHKYFKNNVHSVKNTEETN